MSTATTATAVLSVDVTVRVPAADHHPVAARIVDAIDNRLTVLASDLGLEHQFRPVVHFESAAPSGSGGALAPVTIRLGEELLRYPSLLPTWVVAVLNRRWPEHDRPLDEAGWVAIAESDENLAEAVAGLCCEAVRRRPSMLVTENAAQRYARRLLELIPDVGSWGQDDRGLRGVLAAVVGLGISVGDVAQVGRILRDHDGANGVHVVEGLVGELSSDSVGLVLPADLAAELQRELGEGNTADPDDRLGVMQKDLLEGLGVVFPRVKIEQNAQLPTGTFAVRVNDLMMAPMPLLPPDTCLIGDTSERVALLEVAARPTLHPVTGRPASLAPGECRELLSDSHFLSWTPAEYLVLQLDATLRLQVGAVISQERVVAQLDVLDEYLPLVVRAARAQRPPAELTALLRELALDRVPLRDLVSVLERVVDLPALALGWERHVVLDDPVPAGSSVARPQVDGDEEAERFLRIGMRHQIGHAFASDPETLVVYLLDARLESAVCAADRSEEDEEAILKSLELEMAFLPVMARIPVILTTSQARKPLQQLVRQRHPLLVVLAHEDLPAMLAVQPVARIIAQEEGQPT